MEKYTVVAGEPIGIGFTIKVSGVPDDLTGWTAKIQMRQNSAVGNLLGEWVDGDPEITRDDAAGRIELLIPASTTKDYSFSIAFMDLLLLNDADGRRSTKLQLILDRGVTR